MNDKNNDSNRDNRLTALAVVGQLGLAVCFPVVGAVALGIYLDERFGGGGFFLLGCMALGVAGAVVGGYRIVAPFLK